MENGGASTKEEGFLSRMALNDNKAGMEGLDRDKINKIIMESSKGSRFYENELKREQQVNQRIEKMMLQKAQITEQQLKKAQAQVDKLASELERSRDLNRVIVHVDMDAFYAAVEMRDCPELKDKPMAVGSMSMLSTSNYHARKFGVRAAMPGFIAKKLCPNLIIVPTNFDKYRAVSDQIREIFADYDPHFQPLSLDEAYLDFTDHLEHRKSWPESLRTHRFRTSSSGTVEGQGKLPQEKEGEAEDLSPVLFEDSPNSSPCLPGAGGAGVAGGAFEVFGTSAEDAVREMRFRIEQKTMLTASAGIAPNMMLAKVCSDKNKPNGQYRLPSSREAVMDFIQNLPVRKVFGIGKVSEKMLSALGISSCAHLGQQMALLSLLFSETAWHHFMRVSLGLGSTHIERNEERKSMSTERTFREMSAAEEQLSLCRELCEDLAEDMKKEGLKGDRGLLSHGTALTPDRISYNYLNLFIPLPIDGESTGWLGTAVTPLPGSRCGLDSCRKWWAIKETAGDNYQHLPERNVSLGDDHITVEGKTVTLKLKNVNFEVKTRAWTLPCAVATVDEIFAVAKDLLKTEIENVSPQLLRLRLMGVRISAFVSADEKTPLQKSIVGFLKQSKADSGGPSQRVCQKPGKELLVNGSTQSGPFACPPVVEKGEVPWLAKQRGSEVSQIRGQQQQSFFQRAHAQRLRLQAESANMQEERHGDSPSVITSTGIHVDNIEGSPTKAHEPERRFIFSGKREALPNTENVSVLPLEAHASTLDRSGTDSESLTCPVCCRQVKTSNLYVFNKHIDQCLSNVSTKLDPNTDTDSDSDMEPEKGHQGCEVMDDEREECDAKKEKEREKTEQSKDSSVIETSEPTISDSEEISEQGPFEPHESHYDHTGPVLICPICQVTQDTDDLTVFNCHVDVCLNQDVLHELRGQTSLTTDLPSVTVTNTSVTEREQPLPRHANKGKIKRRGSPASPPSKKARGPGRHNTIDKFFKRQTSYTQNVPPHRK